MSQPKAKTDKPRLKPFVDTDRPLGSAMRAGAPSAEFYMIGSEPNRPDRELGFRPDDALRVSSHLLDGNHGLARVRRSSLETPLFASYVRLCKNGAVGTRHIAPTFAFIKNKQMRDALRDNFEQFAMDAAIGQEADLWSLQMQAIEEMMVAGRSFILIVPDAEYEYGFRLLFVPKEILADYSHDPSRRIYHGVEYDAKMRVVKYHFRPLKDLRYLQQSQSGGLILGVLGTHSTGGKTEEWPAAQVIDLSPPSATGRAYNFPSFAISFADMMRRIAALDDAYIAMYMNAARIGGFFEVDKDAPVEELMPDGEAPPYLNQLPRSAAPGNAYVMLSKGVKFQPMMNGHPGDPIGGRTEMIRTGVAGAGPSFNDINGDFERVSFSSVRHAYNTAQEHYRFLQRIWIGCAGAKITRAFLTLGMEAKLKMKLTDEQMRNAMRPVYTRRSYFFVDPLKAAQAMQTQGAMGVASLIDMARDLGYDFHENMNENLALASKLGIEGKNDAEKIAKLFSIFFSSTNAAALASTGVAGDPSQESGSGGGSEDSENEGDSESDTPADNSEEDQ